MVICHVGQLPIWGARAIAYRLRTPVALFDLLTILTIFALLRPSYFTTMPTLCGLVAPRLFYLHCVVVPLILFLARARSSLLTLLSLRIALTLRFLRDLATLPAALPLSICLRPGLYSLYLQRLICELRFRS